MLYNERHQAIIDWLDKNSVPRVQLDVFWDKAHEWREYKGFTEYHDKFFAMQTALFDLLASARKDVHE